MKFFVGFLLLAGCLPCFADQMTAGDLLKICTSANNVEKSICTFYILGVFEGASTVASMARDKDGTFREATTKPFCVPDDLPASGMELLVKAKLGELLAVFPDDKKLPAVSFILSVIFRSFACKTP